MKKSRELSLVVVMRSNLVSLPEKNECTMDNVPPAVATGYYVRLLYQEFNRRILKVSEVPFLLFLVMGVD